MEGVAEIRECNNCIPGYAYLALLPGIHQLQTIVELAG